MMYRDKKMGEFLDTLASSAPAPGGGSASALAGALGAGLACMVSELTVASDKYAGVRDEVGVILADCKSLRSSLEAAIDHDADAFNAVMAAFKLPKETDEQKKARSEAIQKAYKGAVDVPMDVAEKSLAVLVHARVLADKGFDRAMSDVGVSACLAQAAVKGALLNVKINLSSIKDAAFVTESANKVSDITNKAERLFAETQSIVNSKIEPKK